jgi:ATP-dependent protease ClpP protease subunit
LKNTDPAIDDKTPADTLLLPPAIRLFGKVDDAMLTKLLEQLAASHEQPGPVVLELTTAGGDADTARRMALEIRLARQAGRDLRFLGKTFVYSAGVTVMTAFPPEHRALSADTVLLLHERHMKKDIHFDGALRASLALARNVLAEIETGQRLEREGFEQLVAGTRLPIDGLMAKVMHQDWYVSAAEALELGLVSRLV